LVFSDKTFCALPMLRSAVAILSPSLNHEMSLLKQSKTDQWQETNENSWDAKTQQNKTFNLRLLQGLCKIRDSSKL